MGTFMDKLKGKGLVDKEGQLVDGASASAKNSQPALPGHALQLPVDVYQSDTEIVIYAQLAGMDMQTLDVSIGGDNDVVSIQGSALRPEQLMHESHASQNGDFTLEECHWGDFYRQIILPDEIDPERAEAKTKDGVLALRLPLIGKQGKGLRLNVVRADDHGAQDSQ
ncbi:MAG: Heat shock protein Hsp20 [Parcubacteria group bacterium GW2011_GWA2_43_11]|nr:MAG: Heat shock protein Hsp20 [Parcubacteria group bacterium GW2011_GWA2_43_11]